MLQNVKYINTNENIQLIFESFFSNQKVTMGTLCRKLKRILADLTSYTKHSWEVIAKRESDDIIKVEFWNTDIESTIEITIQPYPTYQIFESLRQVDNLFNGNASNPKSNGYTIVEYETDFLRYTLYRYPSEFKLFYLKMEYRKPSWIRRYISMFGFWQMRDVHIVLDTVDDYEFRKSVKPLFN